MLRFSDCKRSLVAFSSVRVVRTNPVKMCDDDEWGRFGAKKYIFFLNILNHVRFEERASQFQPGIIR